MNSSTTATQYRPSVAADAAGDFVVVWNDQAPDRDGSRVGIFGRRFTASGAPDRRGLPGEHVRDRDTSGSRR